MDDEKIVELTQRVEEVKQEGCSKVQLLQLEMMLAMVKRLEYIATSIDEVFSDEFDCFK